MGFMDKVRGKLGLTNEPEADELFEEELPEEEAAQPEPQAVSTASGTASSNVVDFQTAANGVMLRSKMKVVVIEPKSFDDVQQVANCLKEKRPVVINIEKTDAEVAHRIIDFISGTTYAIAGDIKKLGHNVFLCAPSNVSVSYTQDRGAISADMSWMKK